VTLKIENGSWQDLKKYAKPIREEVFIQEQNIAEVDEWDELDEVSIHFIAFEDEKAVATARLLSNNSIGRVAVLEICRGKNIGFRLMAEIIQFAKENQRQFLQLSAQVYAVSFYEKLGFKIEGSDYLDCGIPHIDMKMDLN